MQKEIAVFGGGCFWCTEAIFVKLKGVLSVTSGYAGGKKENPTYDQVSMGNTGHAEVIQIEFNPQEISYEDLIDIFFHVHDPTTMNQQGADVGTQYRSVILYTNNKQKEIAEKILRQSSESGEFKNPIVTEVKQLDTFYNAETYHKNYYENNSYQPYCQLVIEPKIQKFLQKYSQKIK